MADIRFDYGARIGRLREQMTERSVDFVLLSVGSDLPYFTGYEATPMERLTMLVVPSDRDPVLFVPDLEAARVEPGPFELVSWGETEDPVGLVAEMAKGAVHGAIGDHTRSTFLLGLQNELPDTTWSVASTLTKPLRMRKEPAEIELLRAAAEAADRVLARVPLEIRFSGRTERDMARDFQEMTVAEGHDLAASAIIATGPNGASPHHEPGDRVIEVGDLVVCDFGGRLGGYFSDVTRTLVVGEPTPRQVEIHALVLAANEAGRAAVAPGIPCQEVDRAARQVIVEAGYGDDFIHRTGHGIGLEVHEHPYMVEGNDLALQTGMTFSVEPGIYLADELGVRIEDIVVCGEIGADDLNQAERRLVDVS
ncbi:MAG: M24 family metallopeptidase [Acidimicrobiia bacterium]